MNSTHTHQYIPARTVLDDEGLPDGVTFAHEFQHLTLTVSELLADLQDHHPQTHAHSLRVAALVTEVGQRLRWPAARLRQLRNAALLHDIGKLDVPVEILDSGRKLTEQQRLIIDAHSISGDRICREAGLNELAPFVRAIHERCDGNGYPDEVHLDGIPLVSRIIAVCDAYDASTDPARTYRPPLTVVEAITMLNHGSGSQFDGLVVDRFVTMLREHARAGWEQLKHAAPSNIAVYSSEKDDEDREPELLSA
jgi:putative nucleotidyltransferase with HDIG domain